MAKYTLAQLKERPNSSYWHKKAKELFMEQFRGLPCEVCLKLGYTNATGTVFHHIIPQKESKALKYDKRNGLILCPSHHGFSNDMGAHSDNTYVVKKFQDFIELHFADRVQWALDHRRQSFKFTHQQAYEYMKQSENKEYTFDMECLPF